MRTRIKQQKLSSWNSNVYFDSKWINHIWWILRGEKTYRQQILKVLILDGLTFKELTLKKKLIEADLSEA